MAGNSITASIPAATSDAALTRSMRPSARAILVMTTISGRPVAESSAIGIRSVRVRTPR